MPRRFARKNHTFNFLALFAAIAAILATFTALAQIPGKGKDADRSPARSSMMSPAPGAAPQDLGNPLFLPAATYYDLGATGYRSVAFADVNGDGKPDLVVSGENAPFYGVVQILLGKGDGTFGRGPSYFSGGQNPGTVVIADVNGDGKPDVIVANECPTSNSYGCGQGDGMVGVLLGNGDGTFQPTITYDTGQFGATSVAVVDVNGDGKLDLIVTNFCAVNDMICPEGSVAVLLGNGDGTFRPAVLYPSGGYVPTSIAVADLNQDGKLDLVVTNQGFENNGDGLVSVLLANGDGTFQPPVSYDAGAVNANSVAIADVNGDGKADLVVATGGNFVGGNGLVGVLIGNGDGTFKPAVTYSSGGSDVSLAVADVNGDGKLDVVVANAFNGTDYEHGTVGALLGNGDGTFQPVLTYDSGGFGPSSVTVADVNGDGRPDLVVTENSCLGRQCTPQGEVGVMLNNTGPHTSTTTTLAIGPNPTIIHHIVQYVATVTSQNGDTVTGTVTFQDGTVAIGTKPVVSNQAAMTASYKVSGLHPITAFYSGDLHNSVSASNTLTEDIQDPTHLALTTSGSPSLVGQPVTFTAAVTSKYGAIPDGELVTFRDDGKTMGTGVTVSGVATFTTSSLTARTHTIKATYAGDATFATSSANVKQVVERDVAATNLARSSPTPAQTTVVARAQPQAPNLGRQCATSTELSTSGSPSLIVDSVAFTAQVYLSYACKGVYGANCSSGRVYFYDGTTQIGEGTPNYESCQAAMDTSSLSLGLHRIKATFVPCCGWHPSSGRLTQVVERAPTTTAISSFPNPSSYGQDVTFTATASTNQAGPGPTGKVKFLDGETIIGTAILDQNFEATLTKKTLAAGTNSITAEYFGDGLYAKSTSPVLNQAVNPASTTTAITSSPDPSQSGQSVDFTATVSSSIGARATGTVTFTAGDTTLGTVELTGIHASIATAALPVGSTAITAAYNGSVDFSGSSASLTQTVQP